MWTRVKAWWFRRRLRNPNPKVRAAGLRGLLGLRHSNIEPDLVQALGDPEPELRLLALEGVGTSRARVAVPQLLELLLDGDDRVRQAAAGTLDRIDPGWKDSAAFGEFMGRLEGFV